jgi:hypothetical protein
MRTQFIMYFIVFSPQLVWAQNALNEGQLLEHNHYRNKYGQEIHSPAHTKDGLIPETATAICFDGEYSFSHSHSGTCSRHGGVQKWLR